MAPHLRRTVFLIMLSLFPFSVEVKADELAEQAELIKAQQELIEELLDRVEKLEKVLRISEPKQEASDLRVKAKFGEEVPDHQVAAGTEAPEPESPEKPPVFLMPIDRESDLSSAFVEKGDFPNSIKLPGPGRASFSIGGYIKTIAIYDSDYEFSGNPAFVPSILGVTGNDTEGQMQIDARLSQLNLRTQVPIGDSVFGSWLEFDFVDDFRLLQVFMHGSGPWGEITVGKNQTALSDSDAAILALTDPNVHGAGYKRTEVIRYGMPFNENWRWSISFEDPDSDDVFPLIEATPHTELPDLGGRLRWGDKDIGHVQLAGLYRKLKVVTPFGESTDDGWGFHLSSTIFLFGKDWLIPGISYGEGIGSRLLGLPTLTAGVVMPDGRLDARQNLGYYVGYRRYWTSDIITSFAYGYAEAEDVGGLPPDAFLNSDIVILNTLFRLNKWITLGVEYNYGRRENIDHRDLDSHRIMLGLQFF